MKRGFTLSELLMALTIVGVIAVLTVPTLMTNVQNKLFATQIKNFSAEIEQFAQDQLITHKTRNLFETDFGEPSKLLTDGNFSIVKICTANKSLTDCWKTNATGKNKVTYKFLNGKPINLDSGLTIILKNGVMCRYRIKTISQNKYAEFLCDINGNDKPNVIGRDDFGFYVNSRGYIENYPIDAPNYAYSDKIQNCKKTSSYYCFAALMDNNWKMDY